MLSRTAAALRAALREEKRKLLELLPSGPPPLYRMPRLEMKVPRKVLGPSRTVQLTSEDTEALLQCLRGKEVLHHMKPQELVSLVQGAGHLAAADALGDNLSAVAEAVEKAVELLLADGIALRSYPALFLALGHLRLPDTVQQLCEPFADALEEGILPPEEMAMVLQGLWLSGADHPTALQAVRQRFLEQLRDVNPAATPLVPPSVAVDVAEGFASMGLKDQEIFESVALNLTHLYTTTHRIRMPKRYSSITAVHRHSMLVEGLDYSTHIRFLSPDETTRLLWAYAVVGYPHPLLIKSVINDTHLRLSTFTPRQLAISIWAMARLGRSSPEYVALHAKCSLAALPHFTDRDLAYTLQAYCTLTSKDPVYTLPKDVFSAAAGLLKSRTAFDLSPLELSRLVQSLVYCGVAQEALGAVGRYVQSLPSHSVEALPAPQRDAMMVALQGCNAPMVTPDGSPPPPATQTALESLMSKGQRRKVRKQQAATRRRVKKIEEFMNLHPSASTAGNEDNEPEETGVVYTDSMDCDLGKDGAPRLPYTPYVKNKGRWEDYDYLQPHTHRKQASADYIGGGYADLPPGGLREGVADLDSAMLAGVS